MISRIKIISIIAILLITFPYFVFANTISNIPQTPQEMIVYPYENPDVWWVYGITGSLDDMQFQYATTYTDAKQDKYELNLNKAIAYVKKGRTRKIRYLRASAWLWTRDTYKSVEWTTCKTAYGAIVTRKCDCRGFALGYKAICDKLNMPCDVVLCDMNDSYLGHVVNKTPYGYIDVTFDDAVEISNFVTKEQLELNENLKVRE